MRQLVQARALLAGRFRVDGVLDCGGFATVFRCTDTKADKQARASRAPARRRRGRAAARQLAGRRAPRTQQRVAAAGARPACRAAPARSTRPDAAVWARALPLAGPRARAARGRVSTAAAPPPARALSARAPHPPATPARCRRRRRGRRGRARAQVVAKVMLDMEVDGAPSAEQVRTYQAGMKHEHKAYKALKGDAPAMPHGIPATYISGSLQSLHAAGFIHRDVKPDNFCLPAGHDACAPARAEVVYLLDLGMAMPWRHSGFSWEARDYTFWGTVDYSSVRELQGCHPTPREDLEGLACTLLEMATGRVPFDLLHASEEGQPLQQDRLRQMAVQKERQWAKLLADPDTPTFVKRWMRHLRSLPPRVVPGDADYEALRAILASALAGPTSSAWSSAAALQQQGGARGGKRGAPEPSRASNGLSTMSDTATAATAVQSKRFRLHEAAGDDDDELSMACGITLAASPGA
ncbi:CKL6 [Scenedesmus sp. PABB004]|nr:CKL6 [Scenedesmus sp. PABB004]